MRTKDQLAIELALEHLLELTSAKGVAMTGSLSIAGKLVRFDNHVESDTATFNHIRQLVAHSGNVSSFVSVLAESDVQQSTSKEVERITESAISVPMAFKIKH
ncbi:hypothetical protein M9194_05015 [Vibrio sp. S4M6]|uniref:hypothetical protein n=1 Tax=Vibrio sinus TaxID=2946865 RepID=UPI002029CC3E|nr:hypothetical protein [Vibrio sinus]MCL9780799.1 hypothetical protein [Vibrio sinus]